jgi:hypothetical protein
MAAPPPAAPLPTAAEVVAALRDGVRNVRVVFEAWEEHRDAAGEWQRTPLHREGTAWFDGVQPDKSRIDYSIIIRPWIRGAGPEIAQSLSVGFDGKVGREAVHTSGVPDDMGPLREARILPRPPSELRQGAGGAATGKKFFLPFTRFATTEPFSTAVERYLAAGLKLGISREELDGVATVKLTFRDPAKGLRLLWLDPARGYAMLKFRESEKGKLTEELIVKSLVEAAPGVWFPTEAHADLMRMDVAALRADV